MQNALFHYRRRVKTGEGEGDFAFNDNFVNPLNVISFYWSVGEDGKKILNVWLVNNYSLTFAETTGQRFVDHMEDFLRYMLGGRVDSVNHMGASASHARPANRRTKNPISTDIVEEEVVPAGSTQWQG